MYHLLVIRDEADSLSGGHHPPIQDAHEWLRELLLWRFDHRSDKSPLRGLGLTRLIQPVTCLLHSHLRIEYTTVPFIHTISFFAACREGVQPTYKKVKGFQPLQLIWKHKIVDAVFRGGGKIVLKVTKAVMTAWHVDELWNRCQNPPPIVV